MLSFLNKGHKGFTLIELLVVIAIIGMLSAVTLASLGSARAKSRDARRKSDFNGLSKALTLYYDKFGSMPPNLVAGVSVCDSQASYTTTLQPLVTNGFISKVPTGPVAGDYCYYNYGPNTLDGALIVTTLENAPQSMTGISPSCRNWSGGNWCRNDTVNSYYCICNPH